MLRIEHLTKKYGDKKAVDDLFKKARFTALSDTTVQERQQQSNPAVEFSTLTRAKSMLTVCR